MYAVEPEMTEDADAVARVVREAFDRQPGVVDMVAAIRRSVHYEPDLALVARATDGVVGFVMISHAELEAPDGHRRGVLTLSPLAVDPARQRTGIGSALVRSVLDAATACTDLPRLVTLEGDPRYYRRFGFRSAGDHGITFDLPAWAKAEAAQVLPLDGAGNLNDLTGRLVYPPAFALADA